MQFTTTQEHDCEGVYTAKNPFTKSKGFLKQTILDGVQKRPRKSAVDRTVRSPLPDRVSKLKRTCQRETPLKKSTRIPLTTLANENNDENVENDIFLTTQKFENGESRCKPDTATLVSRTSNADIDERLQKPLEMSTWCVPTVTALDIHTRHMDELVSTETCTREIVKKIQNGTPPPKQCFFLRSLQNEKSAIQKSVLRKQEKYLSYVQDMWNSTPEDSPSSLAEYLDYLNNVIEKRVQLFPYQKEALGRVLQQRRVILMHDVMMGKARVCLVSAQLFAMVNKFQVFIVAPSVRHSDLVHQARKLNIDILSSRIHLIIPEQWERVAAVQETSFCMIMIDIHQYITDGRVWPHLLSQSLRDSCEVFVGSSSAPAEMHNVCCSLSVCRKLGDENSIAQRALPYFQALRHPWVRHSTYKYEHGIPSAHDTECFLAEIMHPSSGYTVSTLALKKLFRKQEAFVFVNRNDDIAFSISSLHLVTRRINPSTNRESKYLQSLDRMDAGWESMTKDDRASSLLILERLNSEAKVTAAVQMVVQARSRGHSVLVMSNHDSVLTRMQKCMRAWEYNCHGTLRLGGNSTFDDMKAIHSLSLESKCVLAKYSDFWHASSNFRATGTHLVIMLDRPHFTREYTTWEKLKSVPATKKSIRVWLKCCAIDRVALSIMESSSTARDQSYDSPWYSKDGVLDDDALKPGGKLNGLFPKT
jgi:hypothetical protein